MDFPEHKTNHCDHCKRRTMIIHYDIIGGRHIALCRECSCKALGYLISGMDDYEVLKMVSKITK